MAVYDVIGLKHYSNELFNDIDRFWFNETSILASAPHNKTTEVTILLLSVSDHQMVEKFQNEFGDYNYFFLINEHCRQMLAEHQYPLRIIGRYETDKLEDCSILIRKTRFI